MENRLIIDLLGHVSYMLVFVGTLLVANKKASGWLVKMLGGLLWAVVGATYLKLSSVFLWEGLYFLVCLHAYLKWRREE
jgi:hypothetical protein